MGTQLEAAAHKLLDFSQPTDVGILDHTVNTFYEAPSPEEVSFSALTFWSLHDTSTRY